ncbi:MAG TPA: deoxyribonuclease IV [Candidatus Limnocylindrales bacterium]|nr:deoxyribonuclease IV [Candidatus Limnocylindrales bacterium]
MLPDGRRIGAHLPLAPGMVKAVDRAHAIGASAIQVFADNPTAWRRRRAPSPQLATFRQRAEAFDIRPVSIHASYLVNLPGPDAVTFERSVSMLVSELDTAPTFGAAFVNVHIGSHRGAGVEVGIERLVAGLGQVLSRATTEAASVRLVLENSAGGGGGLGTNIEELAAISTALDEAGVERSRVGFCIDVAHAWGAGIDVGYPAAIDAFLASFDARIGLDRLVMIHLNDTRSSLGSRSDRHEHLGAGQVPAAGLTHILRHPLLSQAAYILETPGMEAGYDAINLERARLLWAGEPLPTLPAEAFTLPSSSRGRMTSKRASTRAPKATTVP